MARGEVDKGRMSGGTMEVLKRPPGAFPLFLRENRGKIAGDHAGATFGEIGKYVYEAWTGLTEKEREKWKAKAKKLKEEFAAAHPGYSRKKAVKADELRKLREAAAKRDEKRKKKEGLKGEKVKVKKEKKDKSEKPKKEKPGKGKKDGKKGKK